MLGLEAEYVDYFFDRLLQLEGLIDAAEISGPHHSQVKEIFDKERDQSLTRDIYEKCLVDFTVNAFKLLRNFVQVLYGVC